MPLLMKGSESKENNRTDMLIGPEANASFNDDIVISNEIKTP